MSIAGRRINLLGQEVNRILDKHDYLWEHCPEDRIECRTDWEEMEEIASDFYYILLSIKVSGVLHEETK